MKLTVEKKNKVNSFLLLKCYHQYYKHSTRFQTVVYIKYLRTLFIQ